MIFKIKEKPIEITALVDENYTFAKDYFPIAPVNKHIPSWWKTLLPKSQFNPITQVSERTAKSCIGIQNTFKTGFILPIWCDLSIKYNNQNWSFVFSDEISNLDFHRNEQLVNFYENYWFFKISSPWLLHTNYDLKFALTDPFYLNNEGRNYIIPSGINETINKVAFTNIFIFCKKSELDELVFINAGTPLYHIIPLTEKLVKVKTEVISNIEYKKLSSKLSNITFENKGLTIKRILANIARNK